MVTQGQKIDAIAVGTLPSLSVATVELAQAAFFQLDCLRSEINPASGTLFFEDTRVSNACNKL